MKLHRGFSPQPSASSLWISVLQKIITIQA